MATLTDRLTLISRLELPRKTKKGNHLLDLPSNLSLMLEGNIPEMITPDSKKMQVFGYLQEKFNGNTIIKIAEALSNSGQDYDLASSFYITYNDGFSSLSLDTVDCHAVFDKQYNMTYYFLLPKKRKPAMNN